MAKDLTVSTIDRQNILNNPYALEEIRKGVGITGIQYKGRTVLLKEQVAAFFEVSVRTIENYIEKHDEELKTNGYAILKGKSLQELKIAFSELDVPETDFGNIKKAPQLAIFDIRSFLNLAMLIVESDKARILRQVILDIVVDTINQRDEEFLISWFEEENYRKQFTDALKDHVAMGTAKYAIYTNKIYVSFFKEDAREYLRILKPHEKDKVRDAIQDNL
jgi:hypothetical protein